MGEGPRDHHSPGRTGFDLCDPWPIDPAYPELVTCPTVDPFEASEWASMQTCQVIRLVTVCVFAQGVGTSATPLHLVNIGHHQRLNKNTMLPGV